MVEYSSNIKVTFSWEEYGFRPTSIHIREAIAGAIPGGTMEFEHLMEADAIKKVENEKIAELNILDDSDGGFNFSFIVFITYRRFVNNILKIEFYCIPGTKADIGKDFYTKPDTTTYDNIIDAVERVYPGTKDIDNIDSDVEDNINIYRDCETGVDFLTRLCFSYRSNSIFGYSWSSLIIRGLDVDIESIEDDKAICGNTNGWTQTNITSLKYDTKNNYKPFNPWTNENKDDPNSLGVSVTSNKKYKEPEYVKSIMTHTDYRIVAKGYDTLCKNYFANTNFANSRGYSVVKITAEEFPKNWRLGDVVKYKRVDINGVDEGWMRYVIAGNELFLSQDGAGETGPRAGKPFEWTITMWGLDKLKASEESIEEDDTK